jgi:hypothetical protein
MTEEYSKLRFLHCSRPALVATLTVGQVSGYADISYVQVLPAFETPSSRYF